MANNKSLPKSSRKEHIYDDHADGKISCARNVFYRKGIDVACSDTHIADERIAGMVRGKQTMMTSWDAISLAKQAYGPQGSAWTVRHEPRIAKNIPTLLHISLATIPERVLPRSLRRKGRKKMAINSLLSAFECPRCKGDTGDDNDRRIAMIDSRPSKNNTIRRRFRCTCGFRFTTREVISLSVADKEFIAFRNNSRLAEAGDYVI